MIGFYPSHGHSCGDYCDTRENYGGRHQTETENPIHSVFFHLPVRKFVKVQARRKKKKKERKEKKRKEKKQRKNNNKKEQNLDWKIWISLNSQPLFGSCPGSGMAYSRKDVWIIRR